MKSNRSISFQIIIQDLIALILNFYSWILIIWFPIGIIIGLISLSALFGLNKSGPLDIIVLSIVFSIIFGLIFQRIAKGVIEEDPIYTMIVILFGLIFGFMNIRMGFYRSTFQNVGISTSFLLGIIAVIITFCLIFVFFRPIFRKK